jgi:hypothetical protein
LEAQPRLYALQLGFRDGRWRFQFYRSLSFAIQQQGGDLASLMAVAISVTIVPKLILGL